MTHLPLSPSLSLSLRAAVCVAFGEPVECGRLPLCRGKNANLWSPNLSQIGGPGGETERRIFCGLQARSSSDAGLRKEKQLCSF